MIIIIYQANQDTRWDFLPHYSRRKNDCQKL